MIFFGDVLEFAAAEIVVEHVVAVAGDVNIGPTVVVKIADGDAHTPSERRQSRGFCDIREMKIFILMVERDHRVAAVEVAADGGISDGDNVEFAVIVAIKKRDAAAHHFDQIALVGIEMRDGGEAGLGGDVAEMELRSDRHAGRLRKAEERRGEN